MRIIIILGLMAVSSISFAESHIGTIHTLHVNLETERVHVHFTGKPFFHEGSCSSIWTSNTLDDTKFMVYIWPLLMHAKSKQEKISIVVKGCNGSYPKISSVDVSPRE